MLSSTFMPSGKRKAGACLFANQWRMTQATQSQHTSKCTLAESGWHQSLRKANGCSGEGHDEVGSGSSPGQAKIQALGPDPNPSPRNLDAKPL